MLHEDLQKVYGYGTEEEFIATEASKLVAKIEGSEKQTAWVKDIIETAFRHMLLEGYPTQVIYFTKLLAKDVASHTEASWWINQRNTLGGNGAMLIVTNDESYKNLKREMRKLGLGDFEKAQYLYNYEV